MPNLNYRGSVADYYVRSNTATNITEDLSENIFDCVCLFLPMSDASANLKAGSYDSAEIANKGYGIIKIDYSNYADIMLATGTMLTDWGVAFNDGANVNLILYVVVFLDTAFAPTVGDKSIVWTPLSKAYNATRQFSFVKAMFSSDLTGKDNHYLDMSLCLGFLCQSDTEFGQFYSFVKANAPEASEPVKLQDVDSSTTNLPTTTVNGAYVEATGQESDFPYTISGFTFNAAGDRAYWSVPSSAWKSTLEVNDTSVCKAISKPRADEVAHCLTLTGTTEAERREWYWGYLNLIANRSLLLMSNTIDLIPCLLRSHFQSENASGLFVGNTDCFDYLLLDGLKPFGNPSVENSEVNENLSTEFYENALAKHICLPISISAASANAVVIDNNRDLSNYPVPARMIQRCIDYTIKQDIANWWAKERNVMCNEATYDNIKAFVSSNVAKFVSASFLYNYSASFPPFSKAKVGNRIVASLAWQATYQDKLGMVVVSGVINFES